jgi:hypothetical protein
VEGFILGAVWYVGRALFRTLRLESVGMALEDLAEIWRGRMVLVEPLSEARETRPGRLGWTAAAMLVVSRRLALESLPAVVGRAGKVKFAKAGSAGEDMVVIQSGSLSRTEPVRWH